MNDTDILDKVLASLRLYAHDGTPASPSLLGLEADWIERKRTEEASERRVAPGTNWPYTHGLCASCQQPFHGIEPCKQAFWKCAHYPSSIDNFFNADSCEHGCDRTELRWYHNGCHPKPQT